MQRIKFNNDLELSRIIYGMWRVGDDADTSSKHVQAKIESCLDQGITTIDQADIYGEYTAEAIFGKALADSPQLRDKLEIVTKCGIVAPCGRYSDASVKHYNTSAQHLNNSVETSLKDMHTDRVASWWWGSVRYCQ